jgi:OOP family OmpA-OmpF porin
MRKVLTILICTGYFLSQAQPTGSRYALIKLNEVNTRFDDGGPIVSPDGKTLYFFVMNHPDNTLTGQQSDHTQDIWMSKKNDAGVWSPPQHLTAPFNQNILNQVFNVFDDGTILVRGTLKKNDVGFSLVSPAGVWTEVKIKDFERMNRGQFWGISMSADQKHAILYFNEASESIISDLYTTHKQPDGSWSRPVMMAHSTKLDDFGPFISPDQKWLFFATDSQRPGKQGLIDMYKSERLDDTWNNWGPPINLGKPLNTGAEDDYFSMNAAGDVFVARSNSKAEGGNLDIYELIRKDFSILLSGTIYNAKTKQVINGAPVRATAGGGLPISAKSVATGKYNARVPEGDSLVVNVSAAGFQPYSKSLAVPVLSKDSAIIVDVYLNLESMTQTISGVVYNNKNKKVVSGSTVQISARGFNPVNLTSDDAGKFSNRFSRPVDYSIKASAPGFQPFSSNVYRAPKYKKDTTIIVDVFLTPDPVKLALNGKVTNKKTGAPVNAKVVITKRGIDSLNFTLAADSGVYSQEVPSTGMYYFTASQGGFLNTVDSLNYDSDEVTPMTKDLALQPIEVGTVVRLKNIYFDYSKASLKKESFIELEKVVTFLNENPTVEIEIQGHTDSDGPDAANLSLSQSRSQSVVNYIISQGISSGRLRAKGFGETKPIDSNQTPEGRANNRRVEFTVLKT